ncbi:MAG: hypothetical protein JOZ97_08445 [Candidatus Eremiobacteraeota bacterium]|nr:hypothetical protein [Candidatus Eremiobacteraeota bacterium]
MPATAAMHVVAAADGMRLVSLSNALPIVALQESAAFTEVPRAFVHSVTDTMPAHGRLVAAYPYYYVTPAIGLCGPASVLGYADDLLARRRPWYFVGPYTARGSCTWITQTALAGLPKNDLLVAGGWSEYPLAPSSQAQSVSSGTVVITSQTNDAIEGELRTATGGVLVFRNEFDPRWTLNIGGAKLPARLVEGFANGWNVPPGARHFALRFSPSGYVRITIAAGLIWFVLLLSELVRILRNERGHTAAH